MLGGGKREVSNRLFLLEVTPHRETHPLQTSESLLVAAYGVTQAATAPEGEALFEACPYPWDTWLNGPGRQIWCLVETTLSTGRHRSTATGGPATICISGT
jgi:hypothetical protein